MLNPYSPFVSPHHGVPSFHWLYACTHQSPSIRSKSPDSNSIQLIVLDSAVIHLIGRIVMWYCNQDGSQYWGVELEEGGPKG